MRDASQAVPNCALLVRGMFTCVTIYEAYKIAASEIYYINEIT